MRVTARLPINIVLAENQMMVFIVVVQWSMRIKHAIGYALFYNTSMNGAYNSIHKATAVSCIQYTLDFEFYTP